MKNIAEHTNGTLSKRGNGRKAPHQNGNGQRPVSVTTTTTRTTTRAKMDPRLAAGLTASQSHFNTGLRHVLSDPTPAPVNDGGKVVLNLANKTDVDVVNFTFQHIDKMTDNENFTTPQPTAVDFKALADVFSGSVTALLSAKRAYTQAAADRDEAWQNLMDAGYGIRLPYVQIASNGNTPVILSSGLMVRQPQTRTGVLPSPAGFRVDLNETPGQMVFSCNPVSRARGYIIQCADASTMARNWQPFTTMTAARYTANGMEIGKTFAFRIAALGGSSGQSEWSPEIVRTAA